MKTKLRSALLAIVTLVPAIPAARAGDAVAKDDYVNVRGQPSFVGEIITRLKKGEEVTVLEEITIEKPKPGEPAKWFKIAMPANTPVWVYTAFLDANKSVVPKRLNLRAGPGENYSVVGRLDHGAVVKEISQKGEWTEIEMPTNTYAFAAAELFQRKTMATTPAPAPETAPPIIPPSVALTPPPESKTAVEPSRTSSNAAPLPTAPLAPPSVALSPPTSRSAELPPETSPKPSVAPPAPETAPAPLISTPAVATPKVSPNAPTPTELPKRIVRREGIVGATVSVQAPSHFQLDSLRTGETINYLHSSSGHIALKKLKGQKVLVTGQEYIDKRWPKTPVLEVESCEPLPE